MQEDVPQRMMLRALDAARPDTLVNVFSTLLTQQYTATGVRVLLVDHRHSALRAISTPGGVETLDDSAAGKALTTQGPVVVLEEAGSVSVYLPVSAGGDRLGIVQLAVPSPLPAQQLSELSDLATLFAYALSTSSRQTDLMLRAARCAQMTLAAELQWQLLPARSCLAPEYELASHLEHAYAVYADNFDWSQDENTLVVSITDAADHARSRPLLTTLAVTAIRNARRSGLGIADQACLADQAIYAHHRGAHSVDILIISIDLTTGRATAVKAGSPQLVLLRDRVQHTVALDDQIPLGMFERTEYATQSFELTEGDRLLLMSDGVSKALSTHTGSPAQEQLRALLDTTLDSPPTQAVRNVVDAIIGLRDDDEALDDDATLVCLDWHGPGQAGEFTLTAPDLGVSEDPPRLHVVPAAPEPD